MFRAFLESLYYLAIKPQALACGYRASPESHQRWGGGNI